MENQIANKSARFVIIVLCILGCLLIVRIASLPEDYFDPLLPPKSQGEVS